MGRERFLFLPFPRPVGPPFGILTYPGGRVAVIHRSAWKKNSANFALTEFTEVRTAEHLGRLALRHLRFQVWPQHHTLLLVRVSPRRDEDGWRLAAIDRHMGHSRRDVQVVAGVGDLPML